MPTDGISEMLANVERELEKARREVAKFERIKSHLLDEQEKSDREQGSPQLPSVIPGHYKGMELREALKSYLQARKGIKITYDRAAEDLFNGGAVWADRGQGAKGRLHNFKMSCTVNYDLVEQDKEAGVICLAATAGEKSKPKRVRKK